MTVIESLPVLRRTWFGVNVLLKSAHWKIGGLIRNKNIKMIFSHDEKSFILRKNRSEWRLTLNEWTFTVRCRRT